MRDHQCRRQPLSSLLHRRRSELVILLIAALAGCSAPRATPAPRSATTSPSANLGSSTDACAQRLHDLSGGLLLYYFQNQKLPPNLSVLELPGGPSAAAEALVCPVSNQPYVYDPRGLPAPDGKSRLIVYDSTSAHAGRRWAISIFQPDAAPAQTDVLLVPESYFASPAP